MLVGLGDHPVQEAAAPWPRDPQESRGCPRQPAPEHLGVLSPCLPTPHTPPAPHLCTWCSPRPAHGPGRRCSR